ncbi:succinate dehydrogenase assembly factor 2 [Geminicoccaceae bacterium 1502E]|nr:succinate dehydrogenase assembly factor 2 [Geminicoccaceae bacterium 1502E]
MSSESTSIRRKRLLLRSRYRGFLESDLVMGRFAETHLADFDEARLERYEALLDEADHDLFAWLTGRASVPERHDNDVFAMLRQFELMGREAGREG